VALAYDQIASTYDAQVEGDSWMRRTLWRHYLAIFRPGDRVLDVACGTGLDAVFLARHGIQVTAIDISPGMIEQLHCRATSDAPAGLIDARVLDVEALSDFSPGSFDGIVSAFAGLSTVPDLREFSRTAATMLRPGGHMLLHLLNRFSLWEWLLFALHGQFRSARSVGTLRERDFRIGGVNVRHYLYTPLELYQSGFAGEFILEHAVALGCLRPPYTVRWIPSPIIAVLERLEAKVGGKSPFLNRGRFFLLVLTSRSGVDDGP
jgi:ubiquinone/menaquinone biosynthesis C-methylase UbiE